MLEITEEMKLGLTSAEVNALKVKYGRNELVPEKKQNIFLKILKVITEPMFLLLIVASTIYFILGEPRDGAIMLIFVVGIISIEAIQEWKTDKTLNALKELSAPRIKVLRDGIEQLINSVDLVPGDVMFVSEGVKIPADGVLIRSSTLCIDESSLTGESQGVWKISHEDHVDNNDDYWRSDYCYAGTLVTQGTGVVRVERIGVSTEYGKIGEGIISATVEDTPLQKQTGKLVKFSGLIALILFILVSTLTFFNIPDHETGSRLIESILSGITLAMAMIPEEFPVILAVFLSMGAWRLAKKHSLVSRLPSVETLGAVSVLCVDKTGTITENKMSVRGVYSDSGDERYLCKIMGMACKQDAYDPMEKAILLHCEESGQPRDDIFSGKLIKEYPFTDENKMMGNVWEKDNELIVSAKGSPEKIMSLCNLSIEKSAEVERRMLEMARQGHRVIAVAQMKVVNEVEVPEKLVDCRLDFLGLVGLADPPRESVKEDIMTCIRAGVRVVMITGDNGVTASAIARQIDMPNAGRVLTGHELECISDEDLQELVKEVSIFSRVLPEHKMRIVKAFKSNGDIVAMTGDGVNDAPALKYADIGIAMGMRGSEVSREAADLILLDDRFSTIVETIRDGRRIYDNIKKAVGYVFTIHIPIALSSLMGPLLGIAPVSLFLLPIHVVLLELIIDPTCSIVLERQPAESDIMDRPPRSSKERLLSIRLLGKSIMQGMVIFGASFIVYYNILSADAGNGPLARTMGLTIILLSNVFLVQVNSSNIEFAYKTFIRQIKDVVMWGVVLGSLLLLYIMVYSPLSKYLKLTHLSMQELGAALLISCLAVLWYELVKLYRKIRNNRKI